jgi:hypothetical protein
MSPWQRRGRFGGTTIIRGIVQEYNLAGSMGKKFNHIMVTVGVPAIMYSMGKQTGFLLAVQLSMAFNNKAITHEFEALSAEEHRLFVLAMEKLMSV